MNPATQMNWVVYTLWMTAVTWAISYASSTGFIAGLIRAMTSNYAPIGRKEFVLSMGIAVLPVHVVGIVYTVIALDNWKAGAVDGWRYDYLTWVMSMLLAANAFGFVSKCAHAWVIKHEDGGDPMTYPYWARVLGRIAWALDSLVLFTFIGACIWYVMNAYFEPTDIVPGITREFLIATGFLLIANVLISDVLDMTYFGRYYCYGYKSGEPGDGPLDDNTVRVKNTLAGKSKFGFNALEVADDNLFMSKEDVEQANQTLLKTGNKVVPSSDMGVQLLKATEVKLNGMKDGKKHPLSEAGDAVTFLTDGKKIYAAPIEEATLAFKSSPHFERLLTSGRSFKLNDNNAAITLASNSDMVMKLNVRERRTSKDMPSDLLIYYCEDNIYGFADGFATWYPLQNDFIIPFCFFMYAFYIYFLLDSRAATAAWLITCFPAFLGSINSMTGYFLEFFNYMFYYGWTLILLAGAVSHMPSGDFGAPMYIINNGDWDTNTSALYNETQLTDNISTNAHLYSVSLTAMVTAIIGLMSAFRKRVMRRDQIRWNVNTESGLRSGLKL